jgi:hypothetical protein
MQKLTHHPLARSSRRAAIEALEPRRLLSADLSAQFIGRIPAVLPAEGKTQITLRVTNIGDAQASGAAKIQLFASPDATLDGADLLLATANKRLNLKPGKGLSVKLRAPSPRFLSSGDYVLIGQVTGQATAGDTKSENNIASSPASVHVQAAFVDLAAQNVGLPQPSAHGAEKVSLQVRNLGNVTASGGVTMHWYLSADTTLDSADILIAALVSRRLKIAPGKVQLVSAPAVVGADVPLGTYHLLALIAPDAAIGDANAGNNLAIAPTTVQVVQPPPRPHHPHFTQIVSEAYYEQVYVVEYSDTQIASEPPDDGGGEAAMQPPEGDNTGGDVPVAEPPNTEPEPEPQPQPPVTQPVDEPPVSQPYEPPETQPSEPPATQPSEPPAYEPPDTGGYSSSGGDF